MDAKTHAVAGSGILTVEQAATVLGFKPNTIRPDKSPLAVKRLIARKKLPATQLGSAGDWRINSAELDKYVRSGAADFDCPKMDGQWIDTSELRAAAGFPTAIINAASEQILTLEQVQALADGNDKVEYVVTLKRSGAVQEVISGTPPLSPFTPNGRRQPSRFGTYGNLYLAERLSELTKHEIRRGQMASRCYEALYRSPDEYVRWLALGARAVLRGAVRFSKPYPVRRGGGMPETVRVLYVLPHTDFATFDGLLNIGDLIF